jgi:hypothetical protein
MSPAFGNTPPLAVIMTRQSMKVIHMALFIQIFGLSSCGQFQGKLDRKIMSQKVTPYEDSVLRSQFIKIFGTYNFEKSDQPNKEINYKIFYRSDYKISLSSKYLVDSLPSTKCYVTIENSNKKYLDTLEFNSSVFVTSINADIDIYDSKAFVCWVSSNSDNNKPSEIWVKIVNLKTNKVEFKNKVYTQKWGIERVSICFNPFNNAIHISYNDFSKQDDKYLYFGTLKSENLNDNKFQLFPTSILNQDKSEKRYPKFIRTNNNIFLYNTTGDTWGFFAHTGKQGIGISKIDKSNNPIQYRVLSDSNTINEEIIISKDTIFYQHVIGANNGEFEVKKIKLNDL